MYLYFFIGLADVKIPSEFCSSYRTLGPTQKQLESLSLAGLDAPSFRDKHNTHEKLEVTSQTEHGASSSFEHD